MLLSNTCYNTMEKLAEEFSGYSFIEYEPKELCKVVDAMFLLADFGVRQEFSPLPDSAILAQVDEEKELYKYANNLVGRSIAKHARTLAQHKRITDTAALHSRLAISLETLKARPIIGTYK